MPVEAKPLSRPDALPAHLTTLRLPGEIPAMQETLGRRAGLRWSPQAEKLKEQKRLPDFLTDVFCGILG